MAAVLSALYLLAAAGLLLGVCGHCYPAVGRWVGTVLGGSESSPVREAFSVLSEGLERGTSLKEAARNAGSVLIGDAD